MCTRTKEIKTKLENLPVDFQNPQDTAKYLCELQKIKDSLDFLMEKAKKVIVNNGKTELVPELQMKVQFFEETILKEIDSTSLITKLIMEERFSDLYKVTEVPMSKLSSLSDGDILIAKYSKSGNKKKAFVKITEMTKEEKLKV